MTKMKKPVSLLLAVLMIVSMFAITANAMQIYITVVGGERTITLDVEPSDTIENVKAKIQDKAGYEPEKQTLAYYSTVLDDSRTLEDYNVLPDSTMTLTVASASKYDAIYIFGNGNGNWLHNINWACDEVNKMTETQTDLYTYTAEDLPPVGIYQFKFTMGDLNTSWGGLNLDGTDFAVTPGTACVAYESSFPSSLTFQLTQRSNVEIQFDLRGSTPMVLLTVSEPTHAQEEFDHYYQITFTPASSFTYDSVNCYWWGGSNGIVWPGQAMTKVGDVWTLVFGDNDNIEDVIDSGVIFNNSSAGQTLNLDFVLNEQRQADSFGTYVINPYSEVEFVPTYTVTWNNWDGTALKTEDVAADTVPVYDGATPTRAADDTYSYTFSGWSPTVSAVTGVVTYTAQFTPTATHAHDDVVFAAWTSANDLPASGNYYLTTDVTRQTTKVVTGELNLCLNGHTVTYNGTDGMIYYIRNGGTLNLYDAQGDQGVLTGGNRVQQGGAVYVQGTGSTFNMYGGTISGNSSNSGPFDTCGGGVAAMNGAVFNMYGGVITDNVSANGGGVALSNATGNIYGGTISGNTAYFGGGVYASDSAVLNLRGGTVTGNTATDEVIPYPDLNHGFVPGGDDVFGNSTSVINLYGTTVSGKISSTDPIEIKDDLGSKVYEVSLVDSADKYNPIAGVITNGLSGKGTLANFTNGSGADFVLLTDASGEARFAPAFNTVTWNNWDGGNLETDTNVAAGATPSYDGAAPTKAGDETYAYMFSGWNDGTNTYGVGDTLPAVMGDVTYTAAFTSVRKIALTLNVGENGTVTAGLGTYGKASDAANSANLSLPVKVMDRCSLKLEYDHTVNIVEGGSITVQTGGTFTFYPASDNTGVITAVPAAGYAFAGWYNGETLYAEGAVLDYKAVSESVTLTAKFEELPASAVAGVTIGGSTTYYSDFTSALAAWTADSTLTLYADVTTTAPIDVGESKTLDLNGHGITYTGSGLSEVIAVGTSGANNITLTMRDSAPQTAHKYSVNAGGLAVVDEANGTQTFTGGYITGGTGGRNAGNAGGVYVFGPSGGSNTFIMQGGNILGNTATQLGGGVFLMQGGVFLMQGGSIFGNVEQGGAVGVLGGTATISGGSIRNNQSANGGSAIYLLNGVVNLNGGEIRDNRADAADGGAIYYSSGTLNLSGSPVFDGNTDPNGVLDIRNASSANKIYVTGPLDESVSIGVKSFTKQWNTEAQTYDVIVFTDTAFTAGLAENGSVNNFFSADPEYSVVADASGEAKLKSVNPNDQLSVSVDDQIALNIYLDLDARGKTADDVTITLAGADYACTGAKQTGGDFDGLYMFKVVMAPAQIADAIVVKIDDEEIPTSVKNYCVQAPEYYPTNTDLLGLTEAILNYGQAANNVFANGSTVPAADIADLAEMNKDKVQTASVTFTDGTGAVTGASFMALTKPEFRFYTANIDEQTAYEYNQAGVTATMANGNDSLTARFVKKADGKVLLEVTGVSAENMDKEITVTVTGLGTIVFNGNAFAKAMASSGNTQQRDLGAALYNYGAAAKICFGA